MSAHPASHGVSLVELLVGMAIGLLIVAAGTSFLAANLREQRSLALESRLMQDLRAAADTIARELRRSGYWGSAASGVWTPGTRAVLVNPYATLAADAAASDAIGFRFSRDAVENNTVDDNEEFGFRLRRGTLEMQLGRANWQALTDSDTLTVSRFSITPTLQQISLPSHCVTPCPSASSTCPPRLQVRSVALAITGRSVVDPDVVRMLQGAVRLRNDALVGACGG